MSISSMSTGSGLLTGSDFRKALCNFANNDDFTDVQVRVLSADGGHLDFYGHRIVLASASPFFAGILHAKGFRESGADVIELHEDAMTAEQVHAIFPLFFASLYGRRSGVTSDTVACMLFLADKYQVTALVRACERVLLDCADGDTDQTPMALLLAQMYRLDAEEALLDIVRSGFDELPPTAFDELPLDALVAILDDDRLRVVNEETVWRVALAQCVHRASVDPDAVPAIMRAVRFEEFEATRLMAMEASLAEANLPDSAADACLPLFLRGYRLRCLPLASLPLLPSPQAVRLRRRFLTFQCDYHYGFWRSEGVSFTHPIQLTWSVKLGISRCGRFFSLYLHLGGGDDEGGKQTPLGGVLVDADAAFTMSAEFHGANGHMVVEEDKFKRTFSNTGSKWGWNRFFPTPKFAVDIQNVSVTFTVNLELDTKLRVLAPAPDDAEAAAAA